ncbi:glycosyltransferase [Bacteroides fragilis]|nr:glycosyltransferase [Bacteroides fragilis]MCS2940139.1 glycosyltransferase [Bacteroides fragilis]UVO60023.1 glycosyltransferase [Bacteroides fragilis]
MKILLQINVVANSGSTGRIAEELGRLVIAKGWKSYIAYGRWSCPSQSKLIRIGTKVDLFFHGLKSILFDRHGFGSRKATLKLISKIEKIKPDIIHLHNIHGYYLNCKILFEYLSCVDIPVVWTLHDCWSFTGHCVHFQNVGCNKWLLGCFACPNKRDYPTTLFLDNSQINYVEKNCCLLL